MAIAAWLCLPREVAQLHKECGLSRLGGQQLEGTAPHTWYDEGSGGQVGALHSALGGDHVDTDLPSSTALGAPHHLHLPPAVHHLARAHSEALQGSREEIKLGTSINTTKEGGSDCTGWSLPAETPSRCIKGPLNPHEHHRWHQHDP